jgi:hypothetical protein
MARLQRVLLTLSLLAAATALSAAPAAARKRDHDKLPDRWERKFHLNTKKNDAKRDRDRDGLSNLAEYRAHTNPRKKDSDRDGLKDGVERRFGFKPRDRDSDDDGIKDGKENAGKITALTGSSITLRLAAGGKLEAGLAVSCTDTSGAADTGDDPAENPADDDPESDDGSAADDPSEDDPSTGDDPDTDGSDGYDLSASAAQDGDPSEDDAFDDAQFDAEFAAGETCDAGSLKRGARVHEATVDRSGPRPVVTAVTLVRR